MAARCVITDGIVAEIINHLLQHTGIAHHTGRFPTRHQCDFCFFCLQIQTIGSCSGNMRQVDFFQVGRRIGFIHLGQANDIADQCDQTCRFGMDTSAEGLHIFGTAHAVFQHLGIARNGGQRCFQLMRYIGCELFALLFILPFTQLIFLQTVGERFQLGIGDIFINILQIAAHTDDGRDQLTGQQIGEQNGNQQNNDDHHSDDGDGLVIHVPHGIHSLGNTQDVAVRQPYSRIVGINTHGGRMTGTLRRTVFDGVHDLPTGGVVLHQQRITLAFKKDFSVGGDQGQTILLALIGTKVDLSVLLFIGHGNDIDDLLYIGFRLGIKGRTEKEQDNCSCQRHTHNTHEEETHIDLVFHGSSVHCEASPTRSYNQHCGLS